MCRFKSPRRSCNVFVQFRAPFEGSLLSKDFNCFMSIIIYICGFRRALLMETPIQLARGKHSLRKPYFDGPLGLVLVSQYNLFNTLQACYVTHEQEPGSFNVSYDMQVLPLLGEADLRGLNQDLQTNVSYFLITTAIDILTINVKSGYHHQSH